MKKKTRKVIVVMLMAALLITSVPEFFSKNVSAAETAWKILHEEDLAVDEIYGWYPYSYDQDVIVGRKDGMLVLLDMNLEMVKKTKYEQIEDYIEDEEGEVTLLVSGLRDSGSEYAIVDKTGQVTVLGTYKKVESLGLVGEPILYAEKVNGECGFIDDGKEIGFDKNFVDKPEEAIVSYNIVWLEGSTYYVKQYFETEDVYDEVGEFYAGISTESMKEKLKEKQCEFIFYDQTGTVVDIELLIEECEKAEKEEEERKEKDVQVIAELEQEAVSQLPIQEYINNTFGTSTGRYTVNDVTAYRFADGYMAYVKTDVGFSSEWGSYKSACYFAGFFDREKNLVKFGQVIAARDEDFWDYDDGIYLTIRDSDKRIYFYGYDHYANTGNMVKYLYTDTNGIFAEIEECDELATAYPDKVVIGGYGENGFMYLVANPMKDFVKTTSMYTRLYKNNNALKAEYAILNEENGKREAVFYDSDCKALKSIDVSHVKGEIELCDGVVLGKSCALLYRTKSGFYGLLGTDGSIVVDAEQEGYKYGSVQSGYFEKTCVYFEKNNVRYYYYGEDFVPHTEEEYENWEDGGDNGNEYGDITYDRDYLYDDEDELTGVCEKVVDRDGNVLVSHEVTAEAYERDEYKNCAKRCRIRLV